MEMKDALAELAGRRSDELVLAPFTGALVWQDLSSSPELDLPFWGAMGKASSTGLGLALALPERRVWVLDGDGSLLMNLGSLVTIAHMHPANLVHVVLENGVYATTGRQPIPGAGVADFAQLARAAGFPSVYSFTNLHRWRAEVDDVLSAPGPTFVRLKVEPAPLPRERVVDRLPRRSTRLSVADMQRAIEAWRTGESE